MLRRGAKPASSKQTTITNEQPAGALRQERISMAHKTHDARMAKYEQA